MTSDPQSLLAKLVDVVLCYTVKNSPPLEDNATAQRDRQAADANLNRTVGAVQSKRRL